MTMLPVKRYFSSQFKSSSFDVIETVQCHLGTSHTYCSSVSMIDFK